MGRPPALPRLSRIALPLIALLLLVTPVAAQGPTDTDVSTGASVVVAIIISLIVGGGLITFAPDYTDRTTRRILDAPLRTFLYGVGVGIVAVIVLAVLIISRIGILLAIPLLVAIIVIGELGYLAVGRTLTEEWTIVLVVAVAVSAFAVAVPYLGGLVGFVVSSMGLGTAMLDYLNDNKPRSGSGSPGHDAARGGPR